MTTLNFFAPPSVQDEWWSYTAAELNGLVTQLRNLFFLPASLSVHPFTGAVEL